MKNFDHKNESWSKHVALIFVAAMLMPFLSWSQELGFSGILGVRSQQIDTDLRNATVDSKTSWQGGVLMSIPLRSVFELRSGFLYVQRYAQIGNTAKGNIDIEYAYVDVPLTVGLRLHDSVAIYGGPHVAFNQSKDIQCSRNASCEAENVKSVIWPWEFGVEVNFLSQLGAGLYYEYISGDLSDNVQEMKTVGLNLTFQFE